MWTSNVQALFASVDHGFDVQLAALMHVLNATQSGSAPQAALTS